VSERVGQPLAAPRSQGEQPDARVPRHAGPDLVKFKAMLEGIKTLTPDEQQASAESINDVLIAMRAPGNDAEEAALLLKELDLKSFTGLTDSRGRNCRKEAVETLMHIGFPHALQITPHDFEYARTYVQTAGASPTSGRYVFAANALAYVLAGLGQIANVATLWGAPQASKRLAFGAAAVTVVGLLHTVAATDPEEGKKLSPTGATAITLVATVMVGIYGSTEHLGALPGALGALAGLGVLGWFARRGMQDQGPE
jgi:hypothetical protein